MVVNGWLSCLSCAAAWACLSAAGLQPAIGQTLTDNQVHAAYCLWFEQNHLAEAMKLRQNGAPEEHEVMKPAVDADKARVNRFTRYLAATGVLGSPSARAAAMQAQEDNTRCLGFIAACHADHTDCGETYVSPPCSNLTRCNDPDDLPM